MTFLKLMGHLMTKFNLQFSDINYQPYFFYFKKNITINFMRVRPNLNNKSPFIFKSKIHGADLVCIVYRYTPDLA